MEKNSILKIMITHHGLLELYLGIFEGNLKKKNGAEMDSFGVFKWQMEKHFFIEEKAIFEFYTFSNEEVYALVKDLKQEHIELMGMADTIQAQLKNNIPPEIEAFKKLLISHREMEEKNLYPILDREFDDAQKDIIIKRISEIALIGK